MLNIPTFKYVVEGFVVPVISVFGLFGNSLTMIVLNHREVKLKPSLVQILCGLATFDNVFLVFTFFMFTLPALSSNYSTFVLPYVAPYLLPATNTLMTCSVYAMVAVALNRYVEMTPNLQLAHWLENGMVQSLLVLLFSVGFNLSRWFELEFVYVWAERNVTWLNGTTTIANISEVALTATSLRMSESYIRWYSLVVNSIVMIIAPTVIMLFSSYKVYSRLQEATVSLSSDARFQARLKRNQSITRTLFGIIAMFLFCHTGKTVISIYEVISVIMNGGGILTEFAPWAKHLIVINTLLVVFNSSINFAFYCGDVVFRECLSAISFTNFSCRTCRECKRYAMSNSGRSNSHHCQGNPTTTNLDTSSVGYGGPSSNCRQTVLRSAGANSLGRVDHQRQDIDPQSKILLGIDGSSFVHETKKASSASACLRSLGSMQLMTGEDPV